MKQSDLYIHCKTNSTPRITFDIQIFELVLESLELVSTVSNYEFDDETAQMIEKACQYYEHELADEECLEMKLGKIRKKFTDLEVEEKGYYIPIPF